MQLSNVKSLVNIQLLFLCKLQQVDQIMSRANIFLVINLGCEMLYVIDQRLKAQRITVEKSAQGKKTKTEEIETKNQSESLSFYSSA